jgi:hypothetical protein
MAMAIFWRKNCNLLPCNVATAICQLLQYTDYGNTWATARRRRKNMQLAGLLATSISQRNALILRPMAARCLGFVPGGWQHDELIERPMAAQCFN